VETLSVTTLMAKALIHHGGIDSYNKLWYESEQCSTCQIFNFRNVHCFSQFRKELIKVMWEFRTGVCVTWNTGYFWLLKLWFWRWKVKRVYFTGGGGTLWVVKKRIWIK